MKKPNRINAKGLTLIELLVGLVLSAIVIAGIYRLFVVQSKAYTVQDQVVEVQQSIRSAMEVLLRDLRMAGYDSDGVTSKVSIASPIVVNPVNGDHEVRVNYEYDDTHRYEVFYSLNNGSLTRQLTIFPDVGASSSTTETILENVDALDFTYGIDANEDGAMDMVDRNGDGSIDYKDLLSAGGIGTSKVVAIRVVLTAKPDQTNPDVKNWVSPRTLTSAVTLRNQCLR